MVLLLLLAARCWQLASAHRNTWLVTGIVLGACAYYLSARQDFGYFIPTAFAVDWGAGYPVLNLLRNSTTGLFALLAWSMFADRKRLPMWLLALLVLQLGLEEPLAWLFGHASGTPSQSHPSTLAILLWEVLPSVIQGVFLVTALYWMLSNSSSDLVEHRRRARRVLFIIYVAQVLASLGVERVAMLMGWIPTDLQYPLHMTLVLVGATTTLLALLPLLAPQGRHYLVLTNETQLDTDSDAGTTYPATAATVRNATLQADTAAIKNAFDQAHIYRQTGLSIGKLAQTLSIPEYRIRSAIHEKLGYRNFNALLHHYRLQEVTATMDSNSQPESPILTLALTAGYQSINPFNRAFREKYGMTPSQYRRRGQKNAPNLAKPG